MTAPAAQTLTRANRYAANCVRCSGRIAPGDGLLVRDTNGKWAADHPGACPAAPAPAAATVQRVSQDGIYKDPTGTIWKVQEARAQGSQRLYAKKLVVEPNPAKSTGWDVRFEYEAGAVHRLQADWRMTAAEAAAFGALYGCCAACGRDLTDERSIAAGYGPICAGRNGWGA